MDCNRILAPKLKIRIFCTNFFDNLYKKIKKILILDRVDSRQSSEKKKKDRLKEIKQRKMK